MILNSLITDDSRLTLDCAKATILKGNKIDIPDDLYYHTEVQEALSLGIIELVGDVPEPPPGFSAPAETKSYKNNTKTRLTFDCIKASVGPEEVIDIPADMLEAYEIDNAISNDMLVPEAKEDAGNVGEDTEEPAEEEAEEEAPDPETDEPDGMLFEEVTVEEVEKPKSKKKAKKSSKKKSKKSSPEKSKDETHKAVKAKGIKRSTGSSEDEGNIIDTSSPDDIVLDTSTTTDGDDFYVESPKYEDAQKNKAPAKPQKPKAKDDTPPAKKSKEEENWDFFDVFGASDESN